MSAVLADSLASCRFPVTLGMTALTKNLVSVIQDNFRTIPREKSETKHMFSMNGIMEISTKMRRCFFILNRHKNQKRKRSEKIKYVPCSFDERAKKNEFREFLGKKTSFCGLKCGCESKYSHWEILFKSVKEKEQVIEGLGKKQLCSTSFFLLVWIY